MGTCRTISGLFLGLMFLATPVFAEGIQPLNVDGIANAMGKQGELTGPMDKISFPRSDLTVKIGNLGIKPALALINWAAFIKSGTRTMQ